MIYPIPHDFPPHYKGDVLIPYSMTLLYPGTEDPLDFTNATVKMQLRDIGMKLVWTFSSEVGGDSLLTFTGPGTILINEIHSWDIPAGVYRYDLQVTYPNDKPTTYVRGKWPINQDITW